MQSDKFEWDDRKAASNLLDHGIDFVDACLVFADLASLDELDDREDYGEERCLRIGWASGRIPAVCYTERGDRIRIISARKAERQKGRKAERQRGVSKPDTSSNAGADGAAAGKTDWARVDRLTDEQTLAAAAADPDNPPWTDAQLARAKRVSFVKQLRFKLGLGRASFAVRYHIEDALIQTWERHECEPDAMAMAYLSVIADDPEGVARTLASAATQAAE